MGQPTHRHDLAHRGLVQPDQLGSGTPDGTKFLRDDNSWQPPGGGVTEITDLPTAEMDSSKVLAPDGAGGVLWRAEAGGGFGNLDGGAPGSTYGGVTPIDGGGP